MIEDCEPGYKVFWRKHRHAHPQLVGTIVSAAEVPLADRVAALIEAELALVRKKNDDDYLWFIDTSDSDWSPAVGSWEDAKPGDAVTYKFEVEAVIADFAQLSAETFDDLISTDARVPSGQWLLLRCPKDETPPFCLLNTEAGYGSYYAPPEVAIAEQEDAG